ncbi:hypothetical protein D9M68_551940 [compost metagenome]
MRLLHQIALAHQDAVGEAHLGLGHGFLQVALGVHRVHQGDDAVQHVALTEFFVGEEGLRHRRRIGQAGAFDHQAIEVQLTGVQALQQQEQRLLQLDMDGTADAAVGQGHHLHRFVTQQLAVDGGFAELVLDHGDLQAVVGLEDVFQQGGLAGTEKAAEHGDRNGEMGGHRGNPRNQSRRVDHASSVHQRSSARPRMVDMKSDVHPTAPEIEKRHG